MPKKLRKGGADLRITIEGDSTTFAPGDTIAGYVSRATPTVCPSAKLVVTLHGVAHTKFSEATGGQYRSTRKFSGQFVLVDQNRHKTLLLEGPLHIPPGGETAQWPFVFTLPTHVEGRNSRRLKHYGFLPYDPDSGVTYDLPGSFAAYTPHFSADGEAMVQYYVQATLRLYSQGGVDLPEAVQPINLWNLIPEPPIIDFRLKSYECPQSVVSHRLVPGMEDAKLSFSQRTKKLLGSSSVPSLAFRLQVQAPTIMQLGNPNTIPFLLRVLPQWDRTSEIIQDVPPEAKLTSLSLYVDGATSLMCGDKRTGFSSKMKLLAGNSVAAGVRIPSTSDSTAIDVGRLVGLRLTRSRLSPDFTSFIIRHVNTLYWDIEGEIAGETFKYRGYSRVTVLPPSDDRLLDESWVEPPPEDDAPPTFAQVKKENMAQMVREYNGEGSGM